MQSTFVQKSARKMLTKLTKGVQEQGDKKDFHANLQ